MTQDYKLTQAQYALIYGVTERSIRTYQAKDMPLDDPGRCAAFLALQRTRPPGLVSSNQARLNYDREAGISTVPTPERIEQLNELIWQLWDSHNSLVVFLRQHNYPRAEEIASVISGVSIMVQEMRQLAGIPDCPAEEGEEENED